MATLAKPFCPCQLYTGLRPFMLHGNVLPLFWDPPHRDKGEARAKMVKARKQSFDFESALTELESLVERMEQGDLSLEESLRQFETGIMLTRACQQALQEAEQKVEILLGKDTSAELQPFTPHDEE